ncbi:MAG: exodeoxyribonuclease VII small subunit [Clostridia bacterium]|nr:exodeoxyribonuclease VII small subunit [Clostridia bacterium]
MDKKNDIEKLSFEEAEARLTKIVETLEKGEAPLDEMLKLYEEGTALLRRANALLAEAEERVKVVDGQGAVKPIDGD